MVTFEYKHIESPSHLFMVVVVEEKMRLCGLGRQEIVTIR
jgi:hypothetical protein